MVMSAKDYIKHTKFQNAEKFYRICVKRLMVVHAHILLWIELLKETLLLVRYREAMFQIWWVSVHK